MKKLIIATPNMIFDELFEKLGLSDKQLVILEKTLNEFDGDRRIQAELEAISECIDSLPDNDEEWDGEHTEHLELYQEELAALNELQRNVAALSHTANNLAWYWNK